jgi:bifunctional enzyme CysN/CysC
MPEEAIPTEATAALHITEQLPLKIVTVGHVDHGKSTVVGRMFHDLGCLPDGKVEAIAEMCRKRGMPFEWAFALDALKAERDQGITIDVSQIFFQSSERPYVLIDAPGHHEFIKNMVTGAAQADAAVLVVDAEAGVQEETRRHAYLLHLLGLQRVAVAVTKMDLVDFDQKRFEEVREATLEYLQRIGIDTSRVEVVPVTGRDGDNIVNRSERTPWYDGRTLIGVLDATEPPIARADLPLRFPVQDVYKFDARRIIAGRIESGRLKVGDTILFSPGDRPSRVASIEAWNTEHLPHEAGAGQSVGVTLADQLFIERGSVASHMAQAPKLTNVFAARIFWLGRKPLTVGSRYKIKLNTSEYMVEVSKITAAVDIADLSHGDATEIPRHGVGEVEFRSRGLVALDDFEDNPRTGRFVMVDTYDIVGGGLIDARSYADQARQKAIQSSNIHRTRHGIDITERWAALGHKTAVIWLTGLPAAGKTTLAFALERALFERGMQTYALDGENVRHHISADLGFSPEDRAENVRRVGQAANGMVRAGVVSVVSVLSPYRTDRDRVRAQMPGMFHEVWLSAPVEVCEERDPKGLYKRARAGEIAEFTGVSAPYEPPVAPELTIDTAALSIEESLDQLLEYTIEALRLD